MATETTCGKFAGSMHPRLGMHYACVLAPEHEGDCRPGGTCNTHGPYNVPQGYQVNCPQCFDSEGRYAPSAVPMMTTAQQLITPGTPTKIFLLTGHLSGDEFHEDWIVNAFTDENLAQLARATVANWYKAHPRLDWKDDEDPAYVEANYQAHSRDNDEAWAAWEEMDRRPAGRWLPEKYEAALCPFDSHQSLTDTPYYEVEEVELTSLSDFLKRAQ